MERLSGRLPTLLPGKDVSGLHAVERLCFYSEIKVMTAKNIIYDWGTMRIGSLVTWPKQEIGQQLAWGRKWDIRRERRKEKPNEVHQKCLTSRLPMLHFWLGVQQQRRMTDWRWADCVGGMGEDQRPLLEVCVHGFQQPLPRDRV